MRNPSLPLCRTLSVVLFLASLAPAQEGGGAEAARGTSAAEPRRWAQPPQFAAAEPEVAPAAVAAMTTIALQRLLELQEGDGPEQWPYEGVYREDRGLLPVGYRVGGTAITCLGLLAAPGYAQDAARQQAVLRGLQFVLRTLQDPRMQEEFVGNYDVRGWGHIYALELLLYLDQAGRLPKEHAAEAKARTKWLVEVLCASAIPQSGGWNYSRPRGYRSPRNEASTFMTAPALQALFHAKAQGYEVPDEVLQLALDALDRARAAPGGYAYGAPAKSQNEVAESALSMMDKTPGSAARATACEAALWLAGRGDQARLQQSIERFFQHWDDLAIRKSQPKTHIPPYGIAPYYFLYAHLYVAQAIELLPDAAARRQYHGKLLQYLVRSREDDGCWNDRQFGRSAGYGTALALLTMHMPRLPKLASWRPAAKSSSAQTPSK
jgi:hypothetical protein